MLEDTTTCYRHSDNRAAVECQRCSRPVCPSCMTQASIGHHCPECVAGSGQQVYTADQVLAEDRPPLTMALMAISILAFVAQNVSGDVRPGVDAISDIGWLFGPDVASGRLWQIITSGFLHGSLMHIGFNMYALWIFGPTLEKNLGAVKFGLIYLAGLLGGALAVLAFNYNQPTLGASGAVLGLAGGLAAVLWARGVNIFRTSLAAIFGINLALPLFTNISFWGHLGGIVGGFLAGLALTRLPNSTGGKGSAVAAAGLCAVLLGLCLVVGLTGGVAELGL